MASPVFASWRIPYRQYEVQLPVTVFSGGLEDRFDHEYDNNGLRRGSQDLCIWQYTLAGEGALIWNGRNFRVKAGDAMLLRIPGDHRYFLPSDSEHWNHIFLNLGGTESLRIWTYLTEKFGPVVKLPLNAPSVKTAYELRDSAIKKKIRSAAQASSLGYAFLMNLLDDVTLNPANPNASLPVMNAMKFCMEHFGEDISVGDMAAASGYSRCHFSRMFTGLQKISPAVYLRNLRLENARRMLQLYNSSVKDIAAECGFSDESHFCRLFRENFSMTPEAFRNAPEKLSAEQVSSASVDFDPCNPI